MKKLALRRSLSLRLVCWLLASQILVAVAVTITLIPALVISRFETRWDLDEWAEPRARYLVGDSLTRVDGVLRIVPNPELRDYMARNPDFRFAAYDPVSGVAVSGSSQDLLASIRDIETIRNEFDVWSMRFKIDSGSTDRRRCKLQSVAASHGTVGSLICGFRFRLGDLYAVARDQLRSYFTYADSFLFLPLIVLPVPVTWLATRRGLAPLRAAARKAARIDMRSLDQRIDNRDIPREVAPFVDAVNEILARLDQGVAIQRRFTANSAHELRTPISILRSRVDRLEDSQIKREITRDVRRIQTLVEQLLLLAQFEARGEETPPPMLDLSEAVRATIADYLPIALDVGRQIVFEAPRSPVSVRLFRWALECVVTNLIENAVRAEPEGGAVLVRVTDEASIEVVDHGPGVEPEDRTAIFEPFWRKSDAPLGTGLGLSIVKQIIDAQHGRIWVEETPGGGATLKVSFT
ncbi:MAG: sensor histidine kinase [Methylocystaceae bacterium]|nr:MAG: sensor histidine kinase [Methylocystaceae bacterium]